VLEGTQLVTTIGWLNHPNFYCLIISPLIAIWGPTAQAPHMYAAVTGALSVVAFHILATWFLSPAAALTAAALLVVSPNHLFFSRVLFGTDIMLPQILFLAFTIDAARRLSWPSALLAGSALGILLYHYLIVRVLVAAPVVIFCAAQIAAGRRNLGRRCLLLGLLLATTFLCLQPLIRDPHGYLFLFHPVHYDMLAYGRGVDPTEMWHRFVSSLRGHLLLFRQGGAYGAMAHIKMSILPLWLDVLLVFGFADAVIRMWRFEQGLMAALFIIGLIPSMASLAGNNHRTMLIIPIIALLMGNGLERMTTVLPRRVRARQFAGVVLGAVILVASFQCVRFYFVEAWTDVNDVAQLGDYGAGPGNAARRLSGAGTTLTTSLPVEMRYLNYDRIRSGALRPFIYPDWLPENWETKFTTLLFDENRIDLMWGLQHVYPSAQATAITSPLGRNFGGSLAMTGSDVQALRPQTITDPPCGTLMFAVPRRVDSVRNGTLQIDGLWVDALPAAAQPWFAAGLHAVCLRGAPLVNLQRANGNADAVQLTAASLYQIPVHGWLHRVSCASAPETVTYLGVEPFLYWLSRYPPITPPCPATAEDTYSARVSPHADDIHMRIGTGIDRSFAVQLDGTPLTLDQSSSRGGSFVVPASAAAQRLDVRTRFFADLTLHVMQRGALRLPPYDLFSPPPDETHVAPAQVLWGKFADGQFPAWSMRE